MNVGHVLISCIPVGGFAGLLTGIIDLEFSHSRQQGKEKIVAFTISHIVYVLLIVVMAQ